MPEFFLVASALLLFSIAMNRTLAAQRRQRSLLQVQAHPGVRVTGRLDHPTVAALQIVLKSAGVPRVGPIDGRMGIRTVRALQIFLRTHGADPGPVDGFWGKRSAAGLQAWLAAGGYYSGPVDGQMTRSTIESLQVALKVFIGPAETAEASACQPQAAATPTVTGTPVPPDTMLADEPTTVVRGTPVPVS